MTTRTDASGTTQFVWHGIDCVMELGPDGTQTRYYIVSGKLMMFERTPPFGASVTYQVLADHMGSVRKVLDSANNIVAQFDTDAWGNPLPSSYDNIPNGGLMYRFVGSLGVRYDVATGLYNNFQRWYDPTLQRFLSRDRCRRSNRYIYAANNPAKFVDHNGMDPNDDPFADNVKYRVDITQGRMIGRGMNFYDNNNSFHFHLEYDESVADTTFFGGVALVLTAGEGLVAGAADFFWINASGTFSSIGSGLSGWLTAATVGLGGTGFGLMGITLSQAGACPGDNPRMITIYRTVGRREFQQIANTGTYRIAPNGAEGKYFYPTIEQAINMNQISPPNQIPRWVTQGDISQSIIDQNYGGYISGEGDFYFIQQSDLASIVNVQVHWTQSPWFPRQR